MSERLVSELLHPPDVSSDKLEPRPCCADMEIGYVAWSHDRQEDKEVRQAHLPAGFTDTLNPLISALSLRLFGKDITTLGQQNAKSRNENQERGHQTATPVEHAPVLEEDKEPTPVIDDEYAPREMGEDDES